METEDEDAICFQLARLMPGSKLEICASELQHVQGKSLSAKN